MSNQVTNQVTDQILTTLLKPTRAKQLKTPKDYGMDFEEVSFPSKDGIQLKAWYVPKDSNKLAIMTHPLYCSKYGFYPEGPVAQLVPTHVEFQKLAKHLFDNDYSVLFFDFRNHGESEAGPGGVSGIGHYEWMDVVGAMQYVNNNDGLKEKDIAFVSHCMGSNATIIAMSKEPELFGKVKVMTGIQPINMKYMLEKMIPMFGGDATLTVDDIDKELQSQYGFAVKDMSPYDFLKDIKVPVFYSQVKSDVLTDPIDVQTIHDNTPTEKELVWIEGEELNRFDGYSYWGDNPDRLLDFLNKYMG